MLEHVIHHYMDGLHSLLPIEYLLPSRIGENTYPQPVKILINQLLELKKL
jgi:hypothetical protein